MLRQLKAIEQTTGFLKAVELRPDWIAEVRGRTHAQEALASLQIEGRRRNGLMGVGTWRFNPAQGSPEIRAP